MIEQKNNIKSKLEDYAALLYNQYKFEITKATSLSLGSCCKIRTGKLNAEDSNKDGKYPFFTCGKDILKVNSFAFEGDLIVIAGNGEISVKYYFGRCNAYQRTYMLHPNKYFFVFLKEIENNLNELKGKSQGSVIKFITKRMIETISISISENIELLNNKLENIYRKIHNIDKQLIELNKIKNLLLIKYFSTNQ